MYDEFLEKAKARAMKRTVGDPFKKGIEQGPQVTFYFQLHHSFYFALTFSPLSLFDLSSEDQEKVYYNYSIKSNSQCTDPFRLILSNSRRF